MKIPENIRHIEVYYDGRCGMCCTFHEWVNRQPRAFAVRFAPYQSALAEEWFPGVRALGPEREMIVGGWHAVLPARCCCRLRKKCAVPLLVAAARCRKFSSAGKTGRFPGHCTTYRGRSAGAAVAFQTEMTYPMELSNNLTRKHAEAKVTPLDAVYSKAFQPCKLHTGNRRRTTRVPPAI